MVGCSFSRVWHSVIRIALYNIGSLRRRPVHFAWPSGLPGWSGSSNRRPDPQLSRNSIPADDDHFSSSRLSPNSNCAWVSLQSDRNLEASTSKKLDSS